jgi:SAM-dependent methyltransferase
MAEPGKAYLDYYAQHGIIPVRQDISDLTLHKSRRYSLYRHLGLLPFAFTGRKVLEFGPGTGDNAIYVASCRPSRYVLVDGNPASIRAIEQKLQSGLLPLDRVECQHSDILDYADNRSFDVVLCEGVIPGQADPEAFLAHVASFVAPNGLLVITTQSPSSMLAESCRRVLKAVFARRHPEHKQLLAALVDFFKQDLKTLPGMSRLHEDWVLDQIMNPWPARYTFTMPEAISAIGLNFEVLGTSPCFIQDWRWYKSIPMHAKSWNDIALEEYDRWSGFLLDYRIERPEQRTPASLDLACRAAIEIQHEIWHNNSVELITEFNGALRAIRAIIADALPAAARSINDFVSGTKALVEDNPDADFGTFRTWFGRGQQYLSFVCKPE